MRNVQLGAGYLLLDGLSLSALASGLEAPIMTPNGIIFLFFSFLSALSWPRLCMCGMLCVKVFCDDTATRRRTNVLQYWHNVTSFRLQWSLGTIQTAQVEQGFLNGFKVRHTIIYIYHFCDNISWSGGLFETNMCSLCCSSRHYNTKTSLITRLQTLWTNYASIYFLYSA